MSPVILMHGLFGFDRVRIGSLELRYFGELEKALAAAGHEVLTPGAHPTAPVAQRAQEVHAAVEPWLRQKGSKAIILAHSMGGLDARYMISRLGLADRIAALVTIATPHHGSSLADFWLAAPPVQRIAMPLLEAMGWNADGAHDLTLAGSVRFNEQTPDMPQVRYYSVSTACPPERIPLLFQLGYWVIRPKEGDNDGMVSVRSARWGRHLATWPVHHLLAINHRLPMDHKAPVRDVAPLYVDLVRHVEQEIGPC